MMKPNRTSHISRRLHQALKSSLPVDYLGRPSTDATFPCADVGSDAFEQSYLAYSLNRKVEVDGDETDKESKLRVTMEAFDESEAACYRLNREADLSGLSISDTKVIIRAQQLIQSCIGDRPPAKWYRRAGFSGGASTSRKRSKAHPALKWWARPSLHVTPLALRHLLAFKDDLGDLAAVWDSPGLLSCDAIDNPHPFFTVVPGSRLDTVPKNYKVFRTILIEPDGNMLLQKAVGSIIRDCLRAVGINLNDQSRNQRLAFMASLTGLLGTVDLSAASDSIALFVACLLLPPRWYDLLYDLRSHLYQGPDGTWKRLEKLSSMGNGFTFEVESLLFWALTQATVDEHQPTEKQVGIYGDDIVCASAVCPDLERIFRTLGFKLNAEKSFWDGPFRESCGKHYHNGQDVTPLYIKGDLANLEERFRLFNQLRRWEDRQGGVDRTLSNIVLAEIAINDRRSTPDSYCDTTGIKGDAVPGLTLPRIRRRRNGCHVIEYWTYATASVSFADRFESECAWFYRVCEHWEPTTVGFHPISRTSVSLVDTVYTPVDLVRDGERAWKKLILPWVTAVTC